MAAKKVKLSDVARDLHIPTQELITFFMERDANGVKKKGVTGLTTEEINLALEYYSQKSQVENFDGYFATKNAPKQKQDKKPQSGEKKQPEKKNGDRKPAERRNGSAPQGGKKPAAPAAQPEKKPAEEKTVSGALSFIYFPSFSSMALACATISSGSGRPKNVP